MKLKAVAIASFRDMPIQRKLVWLTLLVTGTTLLAAGGAESVFDLTTFRSRAVDDQIAMAELIGINSVPALEFNDRSAAEETLATLKARPDVVVAAIHTTTGELFASYLREPAHEPLLRQQPPSGYQFQQDYLELTLPLAASQKTLGTIYLRSDLAPAYEHLYGDIMIRAIFLGAAFLLALAATPVVQRFVSRPILQLAHVAREVTQRKGYTVRAAGRGRDEIGQLTEDFNLMLEAVEDANRQKDALLAELEQRVAERTANLQAANKELEAFSYSVSHDLRTPLRSIDGFSHALLEDYAESLDAEGKDYLQRIRSATQRMDHLVDDMLKLSRVTKTELRREQVDLSASVRAIAARLQSAVPERVVEFVIQDGVTVTGDERLLQQALNNLLDNAWKFTGNVARGRIEFGAIRSDHAVEFFVRDNGAGFDMAFADRLFGAFQRLHSTSEFPGTGIGLAIVRRIAHRHGGHTRAEGAVGHGATFYVALPQEDTPS